MHPSANRTSEGRLFGLDVLRALAIVLVVVSHTWPSPSGVPGAIACSVLGVELFFLLSGFLIGRILIKLTDGGRLPTWAGLTGFWLRRWYRTLPNYYLYLGLRFIWFGAVLGYSALVMMNWKFLIFLQNFTYRDTLFFVDSWSLAVEEWFYLLFPLCLWAGMQWTKKHRLIWLIVIGLFLLVPSLLRLHAALDTAAQAPHFTVSEWREAWHEYFRTTVVLRLDVLMYGVAAACVAAWYPALWQRLLRIWWLGLALTLLAVSSLIFYWPLDYGRMVDGLLLWPGMAVGLALIVARCSLMSQRTGRLAGLAHWLAVISYALYLSHNLVIDVVKHMSPAKSPLHLKPHTWPWFFTVWVVSLAVSTATYYWFERPTTRLRDHRQPLFRRPGTR